MPARASSGIPGSSDPIFVGRRSEIARLREKLAQASAGRGGLAILTGEPGIGKTQLAEVLGDVARQEGWTVLSGRCYEGDATSPYGPFGELLDEFARQSEPADLHACLGYSASTIAKVAPAVRDVLPEIPEPTALNAEEERARLLDAVVQFVLAISRRTPVLVILDDLQWADNGTVAILRHVARFAPRNRLLLLGTIRDGLLGEHDALSAALDDLYREANYERVVLRGLESADIGNLVEAVIGTTPQAEVVELLRSETSGNPFFVRQVLLHIHESRLRDDAGTWTLTTDAIAAAGIPDGVRRMIRRRLSRLSEHTNRLLVVAAGLSCAFALWIVAGVAGLQDGESLDATDEALGAQLIRPGQESDRYEFVHALVRHAIYDNLNPSRRARLHRAIADGLEQTRDPMAHAAELAYQYGRSATLPGAENGVRYALVAADRAESAYAYDEMAKLLRIALDLLRPNDEARPRLAGRIAFALAWARDYEGLVNFAAEAAALIGTAEGDAHAADFLAELTQAVAWGGNHRAAWILAELGLRHIGERRDTMWAILTRYDLARLEAEDTDNPGIPLDLPEREEIAEILRGDPVEGRSLIAFSSREDVLKYGAQDQPGNLATYAGEYQLAIRIYKERLKRFENEGRIGELTFTYAGLSRSYNALGQFEQAEAAFQKAAELGARLPEGSNHDLQPLAALWELRLAREPDNQASLAQLQQLLGHANAEHQFAFAPMRAAVAFMSAVLGMEDQAITWLETVIDPIERAPAWALNYTAMIGLAVWALWLARRTDHLDVIERNLITKTLAADFRYPMHDARRCMGLVCALQGRYREAIDWFAQARCVTEQQGARPQRAIIDYDEGLMYFRRRRKGDRGRAALLLEAARTQFHEIGMTGWVPRADELLQSIEAGNLTQPLLPSGLTPREAEVLRLIAAGRTNSEIASGLSLSVRTVARHITHVYEKIGARNRAGATAYAGRNRLV